MVEIDNRMKRKNIPGLINPHLNISVSIEDIYRPFTNLPKKIDVGGEFSLQFWSGEKAFIESEADRVGVIHALGLPDE